MTINQAIPKYLEYVKLYNKNDTYKFYKQYLRFISKYIGNLNIENLNREDVINMLKAKKIETFFNRVTSSNSLFISNSFHSIILW